MPRAREHVPSSSARPGGDARGGEGGDTGGSDPETQTLQAMIRTLQQELATLRDLGVSPLQVQLAELRGRLATQLGATTDAQPDAAPGFASQYQQSPAPAPARSSDLYAPPSQVPPATAFHLSPGVDTQRRDSGMADYLLGAARTGAMFGTEAAHLRLLEPGVALARYLDAEEESSTASAQTGSADTGPRRDFFDLKAGSLPADCVWHGKDTM